MTVKDIGPEPQSFNLERQTTENSNYRTVAWSGRYLQLTLMSIPEGQDIGLEMHRETDQFLRLDAGQGRVQMGPTRDNLEFDQDVSDGWCILVRPAPGTTSATSVTSRCSCTRSMHLPTTSPARYTRQPPSAVDTDDEPAIWSVQPGPATDLHG
jgi:mannose-6-phosphate isomerase-like protein (cupin superfamily)